MTDRSKAENQRLSSMTEAKSYNIGEKHDSGNARQRQSYMQLQSSMIESKQHDNGKAA